MTRVSPITLPRRKTIFSSLDKLEKKYKKNQNQQSVDFLLIFSSSIFKFHFLVQHFLRAARGECAALVTDRWWVKSVIFFRTAWRRGKHRLSLSFKVGSNQKQQKKNQVMKASGTNPPPSGAYIFTTIIIFFSTIYFFLHTKGRLPIAHVTPHHSTGLEDVNRSASCQTALIKCTAEHTTDRGRETGAGGQGRERELW